MYPSPRRRGVAGCRIVRTISRLNRKEPMKLSPVIVLAVASVAAAPAFANQDLAQKKNCMACHAIDKKVVGPAYKDVAAKYAGQKDAVDKLSQKVIKGGSGVWGQ